MPEEQHQIPNVISQLEIQIQKDIMEAMKAKQRKESAEQYSAAGRQELADAEMAEEKILETYLPKMLSESEVEARLKEIIDQVGASALSDMGKVMGVATKALAGLADGKTISSITRKLLS